MPGCARERTWLLGFAIESPIQIPGCDSPDPNAIPHIDPVRLAVQVFTTAGGDNIDRVPVVAHVCSKLRGHFFRASEPVWGEEGRYHGDPHSKTPLERRTAVLAF